MRLPSDTFAEQQVERVCENCGKKFIPAVYHQYVTYEPNGKGDHVKRYCCKYTCYNRHRERLAQNPRKGKPVVMSNPNGEVLEVFTSAEVAADYLIKMRYVVIGRDIRRACKSGKLYHGFYFRYKEDEA